MTAANELVDRLGAEVVLIDPAAIAPHLSGWFGDRTGAALAVLRPRDTREVAACIRAASALGIALVPQGGNTGLAEGAMATDGARHAVLSLGRLDRIRAIDADDFSCTVEAGCILQAVKDAVAAHELSLPVALGSQGSAQIGGLISTNAGGINVLRWGMMREQVLGLEVVLADGTLWDGLSTLRKNNLGLDLKQLFIGAEGTFGIVTAAALRLVPRPVATASALLALPGLPQTVQAFRLARRATADLVSAFEFLTPAAMAVAVEASGAPAPLDPAGAYALIEVAASGPVEPAALLEAFFADATGLGLVIDGVLAASGAQEARLWRLRETVNDGQARMGRFMPSDVSVRLSDLPAFVAQATAAIEAALPGARCIAYGHLGDGNVHLNVHPPRGLDREAETAALARAKDLLYAEVDRFRGSLSAEHGIGRLKRADFMARARPEHLALLAGLKHLLDPDGRLNPGCQLEP